MIYRVYSKLLDKIRKNDENEKKKLEKTENKKRNHKKSKDSSLSNASTKKSKNLSSSSIAKSKTKSTKLSTSSSSRSSSSSSSSNKSLSSSQCTSSTSPAPSFSDISSSKKKHKKQHSKTSTSNPQKFYQVQPSETNEILNKKQHYGMILKNACMNYLKNKSGNQDGAPNQLQPDSLPITAAYFRNSKMLNSQEDTPANRPTFETTYPESQNHFVNFLKNPEKELDNKQRVQFTEFFLKNASEKGLPRFLKNFQEDMKDGVESSVQRPKTSCQHLKELAHNFHFPKNKLQKDSDNKTTASLISHINPCLSSTLPPNLSKNYFYNIS